MTKPKSEIEKKLAKLPEDVKRQLALDPPKMVVFETVMQRYRIANIQRTVLIELEIEFDNEYPKVGLRKKNGQYDFVFKGSEIETAGEVTDLMSFAARKAKMIIDEWRSKQPKKINPKQ